MKIKEIPIKDLNGIAGGTTNGNPTPDKPVNLDKILNDKNYDLIAEWLMKKFGWIPPRTRKINNQMDINDVDI